MKRTILLGPPGTGKTTQLLNISQQHMELGTPPDRIAFVSFTRKAANEAATRAASQFDLDHKKDLPYFRTIHSLVYHILGIQREDVMQTTQFAEFGERIGYEFTGGHVPDEDGVVATRGIGDRLLYIESFARQRCITLQQAWDMLGEDVPWKELELLEAGLRLYKEDRQLMDFTDFLEAYLDFGDSVPVDVAIIDEAQDLTTLQWKVVEKAFANVTHLYIAGDDDQSIYTWSGADVDYFLNLEGERIVLQKSHRLPKTIFDFAHNIVKNIHHRYEKHWYPTEREGSVEYLNSVEELDLSTGSWLLLARNGYQLSRFVKEARFQGVPYSVQGSNSIRQEHLLAIQTWETLRKSKTTSAQFVVTMLQAIQGTLAYNAMLQISKLPPEHPVTGEDLAHLNIYTREIWHDALDGITLNDREYYLGILRGGEKLTKDPRVQISTIHGVKGGEAQNVALLTDISRKTHTAMQENEDGEHRVFYVGATRAKENLFIILGDTNFTYPVE